MSLLYVDDIRGKTAAASVDLSNATSLKMPAGAILQTVQTRNTDESTFAANSFSTMFSCSITPKFSTSKILVNMVCSATHRNHHSGLIRCYRTGVGSEAVVGGGKDTSSNGAFWSNVWFNIRKTHQGDSSGVLDQYSMHTYSANYLDSPATTNALTYTMKGLSADAGFGIYFNRTIYNSNAYDSPCASYITLQEVSQ